MTFQRHEKEFSFVVSLFRAFVFSSSTRLKTASSMSKLVSACRFEVHADQVIGLADKVARAEAAA